MVDSINVSDNLKIKKAEEPIKGQIQTSNVSYRKNDFERTPEMDTVNFKGEETKIKNNVGMIIGLTTAALAIASAVRAGFHGKDILEKAGKETGLIDSIKTGYKNFFKKAEETDLVQAAKEAKAKAEQEAKAKLEQEAKAKAEQEAKAEPAQEVKTTIEEVKNIDTRYLQTNSRNMVEDVLNSEPVNTDIEHYANNLAFQKPTKKEKKAIKKLNKKNKEERATYNSIGNNHVGAKEQEIRAVVTQPRPITTQPKEGIYNYTRNGNSYSIEVGKDGKVIKYTRKTGNETTEVTDPDKITKFLDKNPDALKTEKQANAKAEQVVENAEKDVKGTAPKQANEDAEEVRANLRRLEREKMREQAIEEELNKPAQSLINDSESITIDDIYDPLNPTNRYNPLSPHYESGLGNGFNYDPFNPFGGSGLDF